MRPYIGVCERDAALLKAPTTAMSLFKRGTCIVHKEPEAIPVEAVQRSRVTALEAAVAVMLPMETGFIEVARWSRRMSPLMSLLRMPRLPALMLLQLILPETSRAWVGVVVPTPKTLT